MTDRFQPQQKRFIEDTGTPPAYPVPELSGPDEYDYPDQIKSKIRNGPADVETFIERVREFTEYIHYVEAFYRSVEDQPQGAATWELMCQLTLQEESGVLHRKLNEWIPTEGPDTWGRMVEGELAPLWNDIESFEGRDDIPKPTVERGWDSIDEADANELERRIKALKRLFQDITEDWDGGEYLHELLEFVAENEGEPSTQLEGERKRRTTFHLTPARGLGYSDEPETTVKGHHGLVEDTDDGHRLTPRGGAVLAAFKGLVSLQGVPVEKPDSQEAADGADALRTILETVFEPE